MSDLNSYLAEYFLTTEQLATACQLSVNELSGLIRDQLIPAPSYVVSSASTITSHVFGAMQTTNATDGEYFHRTNDVWVKEALRVIAEVGREQAPAAMKNKFQENFRSALSDLNATLWRMPDSFADDGSVIADRLSARVESVWKHFLYGTYGVCITNPVSEMAIAEKEILQEKLTALSVNGTKEIFSQSEALALLELIDEYAERSMPFSPVEYSISSRKRFVEDLRARLLTHVTATTHTRNS